MDIIKIHQNINIIFQFRNKSIKKKLKTDKLDAIKLANFLRAGLLTPIIVPDESQERDRDLIRFRESQVRELVRIKQSICAFLFRKGINYDKKKFFSKLFMDWIYKLELPETDRLMLNRVLILFAMECVALGLQLFMPSLI